MHRIALALITKSNKNETEDKAVRGDQGVKLMHVDISLSAGRVTHVGSMEHRWALQLGRTSGTAGLKDPKGLGMVHNYVRGVNALTGGQRAKGRVHLSTTSMPKVLTT